MEITGELGSGTPFEIHQDLLSESPYESPETEKVEITRELGQIWEISFCRALLPPTQHWIYSQEKSVIFDDCRSKITGLSVTHNHKVCLLLLYCTDLVAHHIGRAAQTHKLPQLTIMNSMFLLY